MYSASSTTSQFLPEPAASETPPAGEFERKVAVATGGSLGIGRAAARRLAAGGASVVICGHEPGAVEEAVAELRDDGLEAAGIKADVRLAAEVEELVRLARDSYGGVDILVNSAGVQSYGSVVETSEEEWDRVLGINLKGTYLSAKHCIPELRRRGGGAIVNVASVQSFAVQRGVAAYAASKGGVLTLTRAMAVDHAADGIRVNAVCPGSIETPMLRAAASRFKGDREEAEVIHEWGRMHSLGRVGSSVEVAELTAFLASDRASFITGAEVRVDGGLLAQIGAVLPE